MGMIYSCWMQATGTVGEYSTSGATVNASLFSVGSNLGYEPFGIVVVPEPSASVLAAWGFWLFFGCFYKLCKNRKS